MKALPFQWTKTISALLTQSLTKIRDSGVLWPKLIERLSGTRPARKISLPGEPLSICIWIAFTRPQIHATPALEPK